MLVQTVNINGTTRKQYDALLASGWFRGTGVLYRSELVCMDAQIYSVQNIRLALEDLSLSKKHRRLLRRNDDLFTITFGSPSVNDEKEELYRQQSKRFKAFVHSSLYEIIFNGFAYSEFETHELCVYHGSRLIAVSYFDTGDSALAGIMCLYDQAYAKSSLGIYTMLKEAEFAREKGLQYYYPGYVLDRPSSFDYKLTIGDCEWLGTDRSWYKKQDFGHTASQADILREKMAELHIQLSLKGYETQMKLYPYFTVGYVLRNKPALLKLPCYFLFHDGDLELGASYDLETSEFVVFTLETSPEDEYTQHLELSDDYRNSDIYELRIMRCGMMIPFPELGRISGDILLQNEQ